MTASSQNRIVAICIGLVLVVVSARLLASAKDSALASLPPSDEPDFVGSYEIHDEITEEFRQETWKTLRASQAELDEAGISLPSERIVGFDLPLRTANGSTHFGTHIIANYVDNNPEGPHQTLDYNCGDRTYDGAKYNHQGTDFWSYPLPWLTMENNQLEVIAAAPAIIIHKQDGNFDKQCSITGAVWNAVYVEHADGSVAWYGHLKSGSLTEKEVGDTLDRGEYIGVVGSSGNTTGPHLHFEVYDADENLIDPFEGECNSTDDRSWWLNQEEYYAPAVLAITTGADRTEYSCGELEKTYETDTFDAYSEVYFTTYFRDAQEGLASTFTLRRPNGSVYKTWTYTPTIEYQAATYLTWKRTIDESYGEWVLEVDFNDETVTKSFSVVAREVAEQPTAVGMSSTSAFAVSNMALPKQAAIILFALTVMVFRIKRRRV